MRKREHAPQNEMAGNPGSKNAKKGSQSKQTSSEEQYSDAE